jgi:hypothetical protein
MRNNARPGYTSVASTVYSGRPPPTKTAASVAVVSVAAAAQVGVSRREIQEWKYTRRTNLGTGMEVSM